MTAPATNTVEKHDAAAAQLSVRDLRVWYPQRSGLFGRISGQVKAVDGVSFELAPGQTLGLVGESGCGKTTVGRAILRLIPATSGTVTFDGHDVFSAAGAELKRLRRQMQIVFQDPAGSLNPRMRIGTMLAEPLIVHALAKSKDEAREKAAIILERCGMPRAAMDRYPHQFSGGQRQRIAIARALLGTPCVLVLDEATSNLDAAAVTQLHALIDEHFAQCTRLVISHAPWAVPGADAVFRLEHGAVRPVDRALADGL